MKYDNIRAFEKHLEGAAPNHFSQIYLVMGKDDYDRKQATERLIKSLQKHVPDAESFSGEDGSGDQLMNELGSLSLFSKTRVIVVYQAEKLSKQVQKHLQNYFSQPNKTIYLILDSSGINRSTGFYKQAEKAGIVLDLPEEKPWQKEKSLIQKIQEKIKSEGKQIDPHACKLLVQQLGTDQTLVFNEIEKLLCYAIDRSSITLQDVGQICCSMNLENGWELGEAIFRRDARKAVSVCHTLLQEETQLLGLLRQIRHQFQTQFQICGILNNGGSPEDIQKNFPYMRGQILQKNIQSAQNYGIRRFREGMIHIDEAELSAKNSGCGPELLAERLMMKLTT